MGIVAPVLGWMCSMDPSFRWGDGNAGRPLTAWLEGRIPEALSTPSSVIPAKAGIHAASSLPPWDGHAEWTPAFAGVTVMPGGR
ncbi:MAG: hypothetical protein QOG72_1864 [Sphingomonadales bacterium]|jgi:hypothetical protein|nr:hypothetical protein [Sphingomonadales bacterium]